MSGKYTKRKAGKKKSYAVMIGLVLVAAMLLITAAFLLKIKDSARPVSPEVIPQTDEVQETKNTEVAQEMSQRVEPTAPPRVSLRNDLEVLDIGAYTGSFVEDGSDELVSNVLMMKLINNGEDTVEYARITMDINGETAEFTISTLKPGESIVLLEKNRMAYDKSVDYENANVICENLALFQEPLNIHEDKLSIQILNGAINVTNISGADINGRVAIYYKNKAAGVYYGGITYRIVLENGLKAGEVSQIMASHFSETGSEIVFVTISQ